MDCGIQNIAMISVPPPNGGESVPPPTTSSTAAAATALAGYPAPDSDQAQFEADKRAVYKHPLFPLLALLFERCELATQSSDPQSSDAFNLDIQAFVQHQERDRKPFLANEPEIDGLMIKAIQVLRIHLLELEKVQELCKDFCNRYITCLKGKMQSENLLRSDYPQGTNLMNLESNNNGLMSHGNSDSGSASNSPIQYTISPTNSTTITNMVDTHHTSHHLSTYGGTTLQTSYETNATTPTPPPPTPSTQLNSVTPSTTTTSANNCTVSDGLIVHGSTPLSQIGANLCTTTTPTTTTNTNDGSGPLSPAPTTPGGSADDCDSDFQSRIGGGTSKKQKRGVLPKHATSVMRSWLFQHLVHPYPTEDEKRHIAAQTNLTLLQVNNWFINARRRILQPMLDASAPTNENSNAGIGGGGAGGGGGVGGGATGGGGSPVAQKKKKNQNNNRRFWSQDFANMQIDSGMLSSSDDGGDSYSSDGDDGLIIDATQDPTTTNQNGLNYQQNGGDTERH